MIKGYLERKYNLKFFNKTIQEISKNMDLNRHFDSVLTINGMDELIRKINYVYRQSKETRTLHDKCNSSFAKINYEDIERDLHSNNGYEMYNDTKKKMQFVYIKPDVYALLQHLFFEK